MKTHYKRCHNLKWSISIALVIIVIIKYSNAMFAFTSFSYFRNIRKKQHTNTLCENHEFVERFSFVGIPFAMFFSLTIELKNLVSGYYYMLQFIINPLICWFAWFNCKYGKQIVVVVMSLTLPKQNKRSESKRCRQIFGEHGRVLSVK